MEQEYEEGKENRKILYKYLDNHYGSNKAKELMIENNENLFGYHGLAWALGKIDFDFFCEYFLQDTFTPKPNNAARKLAPVHYEVWDNIKEMFQKDNFDKLELIMPRGTAKTTVCDFAVSVWLHCYQISVYTLVCGKTEQDSIEFIAQTRQAFEENKYIIKAFGQFMDIKNCTVNKLELELINKTKIQAISSTSSMRGKKYNGSRPSCIIADDYQGKSDIITEESRERKYRTWMEDSEYAGDEAVYRDGKKIRMATKFIVLGTILHKDCFMSRLLKNKDYHHILKRFVEFNVDEYFSKGLWEEFRKIYFDSSLQDSKAAANEFYYQHEKEMQYKNIWQDKYDCLKQATKYFNDPVGFKQEMMNDASKIGERKFKSIRTETPEIIENHSFVKTMLLIDPAGTDNKNKNTEDYFAFLVGSQSENSFKYVRKGEIKKLDRYDDYISHTIELLKLYEDITHVYIEKNTYMGADINKLKEIIDNDSELKNRNIEFINEMQSKNKNDKIFTIVGEINNGQIIFNKEDTEFYEQIKDFAGQEFSTHDDAPDITAEFANRIGTIKVMNKVKLFDRKLLGI